MASIPSEAPASLDAASLPLLGEQLEAEGARQEQQLRARAPERAKSTAISQLFSIFFAFIALICFIGAHIAWLSESPSFAKALPLSAACKRKPADCPGKLQS